MAATALGKERSAKRHRTRWILERIALDGCIALVAVVPARLARRVAGSLGFVAWYIMRRWRVRALENVETVFSHWSEEEREALVHRCLEEVGRNAVDWAIAASTKTSGAPFPVVLHGAEHLAKALGEGRGALLVTGHYGLWELIPSAVRRGLPDLEVCVVGRELRNPYVFRRILELRISGGCAHVRPRLSEISKALRRGAAVGILVDQRTPARKGGLLVPFLGQPAWTTGGPAAVALRTRSPVLPVHAIRNADGSHHIEIGRPLPIQRNGSLRRDIVTATTCISGWLEGVVRRRPEQWIWFHRRWLVDRSQRSKSKGRQHASL